MGRWVVNGERFRLRLGDTRYIEITSSDEDTTEIGVAESIDRSHSPVLLISRFGGTGPTACRRKGADLPGSKGILPNPQEQPSQLPPKC